MNTLELQQFDALREVPEPQLQWLIDNCETERYTEGTYMYKPGDEIRGVHFILSGSIEFYRIQGGNKVPVTDIEARQVTGILPFSRARGSIAFSCCKTDVELLTFPKARLREMISLHYELTQALVFVMTSRVRDFTIITQQNEKMMALGKLAAGLAHELNNPAAAIVRGSDTLGEHLRGAPDTFRKLLSARLTPEEADFVCEKIRVCLVNDDKPVPGMLERSSQEDAISDWLYDHKIPEAPDMAENFRHYGLMPAELDTFAAKLPAEYLPTVLSWISSHFTTERMLADIREASQRISGLVKSVKIFTHMDGGADKQFIDIHTGIRNTLVMMEYKLRKSKVVVKEEFDMSLPPVYALSGELNQVWTNLIDNAADALEQQGNGMLTIRTERDGEFVKVSVTDNGPGIPPENLSRIFDPFFTTKEIGKGTGLGLDAVINIIRQHRGTVKATSEPGNTVFTICFPINGEVH
ncbi:ATP-binding protein [Chitinophaga deserti]|uniref:ATP-binding protein n=1 Tax=Chitinophaga deserti TaxID=2164099 RepID=UPI001E3F4857|nr:ATP-binding protein [Chitinophaga deserti]